MALVGDIGDDIEGLQPRKQDYCFHMLNKSFTTFVLAALLLISGHYFIQEKEEMLLASSRSAVQDMIPPMDQKASAQTTTATFALG
jgi:hypothetical protein